MAKKTFTLSANIENGIAEGSKYIVTPNVQKVLQEIVEGYHTGIHSFSIIGTYGTGKSSFLLHLEQDLLASTKKKELLKNTHLLYDGNFEILNILGIQIHWKTCFVENCRKSFRQTIPMYYRS